MELTSCYRVDCLKLVDVNITGIQATPFIMKFNIDQRENNGF